MTTITPNTAALGLSGNAASRLTNLPLQPGYGGMRLTGGHALVTPSITQLQVNLPYLLATFADRRRIIRASTDPIRDVVYNTRDTEIQLAFELNGAAFDASGVTDIELEYESADGMTTGTLTLVDNPTAFDLSRVAVVRGQYVGVLQILLTPTLISEFFAVGLWTFRVFMEADGDLTYWGEWEVEIRGVYDEVLLPVLTGSMAFSGYAPTVRYDFIQPGTGALQFVAYQPDVFREAGMVPATATIAITGSAPTILGFVQPAAGGLSLSGVAPVIT